VVVTATKLQLAFDNGAEVAELDCLFSKWQFGALRHVNKAYKI
jgi:hypothetical protein